MDEDVDTSEGDEGSEEDGLEDDEANDDADDEEGDEYIQRLQRESARMKVCASYIDSSPIVQKLCFHNVRGCLMLADARFL